jgi:hypothetical protein
MERSDGFIGCADAVEDFSADPDVAFDLTSGRVLDIGAGAARASLALQDRGQDVLALDIPAGGFHGGVERRDTEGRDLRQQRAAP